MRKDPMTTAPTTGADLTVGAAVTLPGKGGTGVVEYVGACGYGRCPWGDRCVTVRPDVRGFTTRNFSADQLAVTA